jgi:hypothetical protein
VEGKRRENGREVRPVGVKKEKTWVPQVGVGLGYEIKGMTGAGKLMLY